MTRPTVGVHVSVEGEVPPERIRTELSTVDAKVSVVRDSDGSITDRDAILTSRHSDAFLDGGLR